MERGKEREREKGVSERDREREKDRKREREVPSSPTQGQPSNNFMTQKHWQP